MLYIYGCMCMHVCVWNIADIILIVSIIHRRAEPGIPYTFGPPLTEDGQTTKTRRVESRKPHNTGKERNTGVAPLGDTQDSSLLSSHCSACKIGFLPWHRLQDRQWHIRLEDTLPLAVMVDPDPHHLPWLVEEVLVTGRLPYNCFRSLLAWILTPIHHLCGFLACYGIIIVGWGFNRTFTD